MDNLTHSLVGALIGQAGLKRKTGLAMPALIIGANIPDIDGACMVFGTQRLAMRRGLTHGPIAWVLLPLVLAGILWWFDRWQARRGKRPESRLPVHFGWLYALSLVACLSHPALDWMNSYGIRFLEPFSSQWFYGDTLFIIDLWLWLALGFATWLSLRREKRGKNWRVPAVAALVAALGYIGVNLLTTASAERMQMQGASYGPTIASPVPLVPWKRDLIFPNPAGRHAVLAGYSAPGEETSPVLYVGDAWLPSCGLDAVASENRDVAAFLFWSRVPYVERGSDGALLLRDARFIGRGGQFAVPLPPGTCTQFYR